MKYIAHRGLSSKAPENTIEAFLLAAKDSHYFGIECDIQSTSDGYLVVYHDLDLSRLNKTEELLKNKNLEYLIDQKIFFGSNYKKYQDLRIPLLNEFLDICSSYNKTAFIEIKELLQIDQLLKFSEMLDAYQNLNVTVISFDINYLKYLRTISKIDLMFLSLEINDEIIYDCKLFEIGLNLNKESITHDVVQNLKNNGLKVGVFTVNDIEDALAFEQMGVDYLTTDKL
jgi:glycerophosphoryl diester phosphodiesterase